MKRDAIFQLLKYCPPEYSYSDSEYNICYLQERQDSLCFLAGGIFNISCSDFSQRSQSVSSSAPISGLAPRGLLSTSATTSALVRTFSRASIVVLLRGK